MDTKFKTGTDDEKLKAAAFKFANDADNMEGFEDINGKTMSIPFIRILQKLSPQLDKQKPEFVMGAEEGHFFNTVTKQDLGDSINIIVLKFEHVYIEWRPNRGGFVSYHSEDNAARIAVDTTFGAWKTKDGNELQENYAYLVLVEGHEAEGPAVLSLSSSAIKMAKNWNRLMVTHVMENGKKAMPYYLVWNLSTEYQKNDKGTWYAPAVKFVRYIDEQQYSITTKERLALPARRIDYAQIEQKPQHEDTEY